MTTYTLVIFDFDGTLADSAAWFMGVLNAVARRYGFREVNEAEMQALRGQDNRAIVRHLGVPAWKMPFIARHMRALMREADSISLFDGVPAMLRALHAQGIMLAIVSSNSEENVRRILGAENAGLIRHYGCGASIFGKAAKFRRILKASGVPRTHVIAIGDEVRDIEAARHVGIGAGSVTWGYATADLLRSREPDLVFDGMEAIPRLLAS